MASLPNVFGKLTVIKGDKGKIAPGKAVVIECWATWCPPCRASIPHLTQLAAKYNNVVFVGVTSEPADTARPFVERMGSKMDYIVASDDGGEVQTLMEKHDVMGIPHAFLYDKEGKLVYSGHPMDGQFVANLAKVN